MSETSCMKGTSAHIKNMWIRQLCNRKDRDCVTHLRARKVSGAFKKRAPGPRRTDINRPFEEARFIRRGKITRDFHARSFVPYIPDKI